MSTLKKSTNGLLAHVHSSLSNLASFATGGGSANNSGQQSQKEQLPPTMPRRRLSSFQFFQGKSGSNNNLPGNNSTGNGTVKIQVSASETGNDTVKGPPALSIDTAAPPKKRSFSVRSHVANIFTSPLQMVAARRSTSNEHVVDELDRPEDLLAMDKLVTAYENLVVVLEKRVNQLQNQQTQNKQMLESLQQRGEELTVELTTTKNTCALMQMKAVEKWNAPSSITNQGESHNGSPMGTPLAMSPALDAVREEQSDEERRRMNEMIALKKQLETTKERLQNHEPVEEAHVKSFFEALSGIMQPGIRKTVMAPGQIQE